MTVIPWPSERRETRLLAQLAGFTPATYALLARVTGIEPAITLRLLVRYGSFGALRHIDAASLRTEHGVTPRQAARLHDALDLATNLLLEPGRERQQVTSPRDAANMVLPEMGLLEQEQMRLLLLDTKHHVITSVTLYAGTVNECHVRVAEVFREAVRRTASALIVAHNHPSGMVDPSPEDIRMTKQIVQAGRLLDIDVLDHLIVARDRYTSLHERGFGWE